MPEEELAEEAEGLHKKYSELSTNLEELMRKAGTLHIKVKRIMEGLENIIRSLRE